MLNTLIGLPSNEQEVLSKILKSVVDSKSSQEVHSFRDAVAYYVRNQKAKPSDKLLKKISDNEIDVSLELAKAYVSEIEFILVSYCEKLSSKGYTQLATSLHQLVEENKGSKALKKFLVNPDCEEILAEYQKLWNYFYFLCLKKDVQNFKEKLHKLWNGGHYFAAFKYWIKIEYSNIEIELRSITVKEPLDSHVFLEQEND